MSRKSKAVYSHARNFKVRRWEVFGKMFQILDNNQNIQNDDLIEVRVHKKGTVSGTKAKQKLERQNKSL